VAGHNDNSTRGFHESSALQAGFQPASWPVDGRCRNRLQHPASRPHIGQRCGDAGPVTVRFALFAAGGSAGPGHEHGGPCADAITLTAGTRIDNNAGLISATNSASLTDANLSIAAGSINNTNAHLETTDQTGPGNRIVSFRVNGSSQLLDSKSAWLYNRGSGEILDAANWRAMGDEDNYRLLLPSAAYPAERYGPPFDYSRGARGDSAVAIAYTPAYSQGAMGDGGIALKEAMIAGKANIGIGPVHNFV